MTPGTADKLQRQLRRTFRGSGGITVFATDDDVSIVLTREASGRAGGGGNGSGGGWSWAKVDAVRTSDFDAYLVDAAGNEVGDKLTVSVYAATTTGFTITPTLANTSPKLTVDSYVRVENRTGFREGWWLHDLAFETCT